jgi:NDP-4-keto-2,6-dideoxyhexose 3-C-methyltransferase
MEKITQEGVKKITRCRICGSVALAPIMSLGSIFVSDFVLDRENYDRERYPLELVLCDIRDGGCGLLQLAHTVDPANMYQFYYYHSGANPTMKEALKDIVRCAESMVSLGKNDFVMDIGCNDGSLLRFYSDKNINLIGFDPAKNLIPEAKTGTRLIINDYFSSKAFADIFPDQKVKIITSIAMFYDLDDPNRFVLDVKTILHEEGLWIIQMSYLPSMLETNAFDNICHEHLGYYSLNTLKFLLTEYDLKIVDVSLNEVNGGSFRVYIKHEEADCDREGLERVRRLEIKEQTMGLKDKHIYHSFAQRVESVKEKVNTFIESEKRKGKTIYVYGASTKGNTFLQYLGLDHRLITAAIEKNTDKYKKMTVGTWVPIVSEKEGRKAKPDYFLVLPWHFLDYFIEREKQFLADGGQFIVPLPEMKVIGAAL